MLGASAYVYLIDKTHVGPVALFCAPKTGCTSLTEIAKHYGISHADPSNWHICDDTCIKGRTVILTVRNPRSRLLSLWRHFCHEKKTQVTLGVFIYRQQRLRPFFKYTLSDWYKPVLERSRELIRIETFHDDLERLLGWTHRTHINKTNSGHWKNHQIPTGNYDWWTDDARNFGYLD